MRKGLYVFCMRAHTLTDLRQSLDRIPDPRRCALAIAALAGCVGCVSGCSRSAAMKPCHTEKGVGFANYSLLVGREA